MSQSELTTLSNQINNDVMSQSELTTLSYQINELKHENFKSEKSLDAVGPVQTVSAIGSNCSKLLSGIKIDFKF